MFCETADIFMSSGFKNIQEILPIQLIQKNLKTKSHYLQGNANYPITLSLSLAYLS